MTPKSEDEHHWQCLEDVSLAEFMTVSPFARYAKYCEASNRENMYVCNATVCVCVLYSEYKFHDRSLNDCTFGTDFSKALQCCH